jgi:hypothetical protein
VVDFPLVFRTLLQKFDQQNVQYALIGGFAMHVAGFTRATKDIDFLVKSQDLPKIRRIMEQLGYQLTHESEEFSNYWHPMAPLGCVDYLYAHRSYAKKMLERAQKQKILGDFEAPVLVAEDIIGLKVQSMVNNPLRRSLDMVDIEYLVRNSKKLNLGIIKEYFHLFGLDHELEELLKRAKDAQ